MKLQTIFTASLLATSLISFSQIDSTKRINPANIRTQGDNERYWAQEIFDKKYKPEVFEKYKGSITLLSERTLSYDGNIMTIGYTEKDLKVIFEKGIIYPALFSGFKDGKIIKPDTTHKPVNVFFRLDSLAVGIMEEFEFLNPSSKIKRYKLYVSRPNLMNPSMYVIEFTNEDATKETKLSEFLEGARLTFLEFVSILI